MALENVVVCVADAAYPAGVAPCSAGFIPQVVERWTIPVAQSGFFDAYSQSFDAATGSGFFGAGFAIVMVTGVISYSIGAVIRFLRDEG